MVGDHRQGPLAQHRHDGGVGDTRAVEDAEPQRDPLDTTRTEHQLLLGPHRAEVPLQRRVPALGAEDGRVLGQQGVAVVPVAVAEHHRLGHHPACPDLPGGVQQVGGAGGAQGVGGVHVLVPGQRLAAQGGCRMDDNVEPEPVHGPQRRVAVQQVRPHLVARPPAQPCDLVAVGDQRPGGQPAQDAAAAGQ